MLALVATGCQSLPFSPVAEPRPSVLAAPSTSPRPQGRPPTPVPVAATAVDPVSADLAALYARIESDRRARGLMRTDDGSRDVPLSAVRLVQIWTEVALRDEHQGIDLARRGGAVPLRRWEAPVVLRLEFGPSVPAAVQAGDRRAVADLVGQIAAATRHPVRLAGVTEGRGNFHVLVLSEAERRAIAPRLRVLVPGIDEGTLRLVADLPREVFCMALAFARGGGWAYTDAIAIVRAEHSDLTRLACYHEEIAQGMGLAADSPRARPSVFNDDQEFALLTVLDLALLRLHYDPRLRPGLREAEALPIAAAIAEELAAGER